MNSKLNTIAAVAIALVAAVPAFAGTQVVAGNGVTLTEAAAIKFNRDTRSDDRQTVSWFPARPATPASSRPRPA